MYIDFAGDTLSYVEMDTGEIISVQTFAAVLPCSGYTFITCIPSQGIEHFLSAVDALPLGSSEVPHVFLYLITFALRLKPLISGHPA